MYTGARVSSVQHGDAIRSSYSLAIARNAVFGTRHKN
jgi:hypothetical protein